MTKLNAAVIGLGSMGWGAAVSLLRAGLPTVGVDLRSEVLTRFEDAGGTTATSPSEAVKNADIAFIFVVNAAQCETVLFGEHGAIAAARPNTIFALCATMPPSDAARLCKRISEAGMCALDLPVSGGSAKALSGEMTLMAAGAPADFDRAAPALDAISAKIFRLGDTPGMGSQVKMINQLLAGVHIAATAEAMTLGAAAGIDLKTLLDVISACAGTSWMFENRGPHIVEGDYTPHSAVDIFVKDLGIVASEAQGLGCPTPLTATSLVLFEEASAAGLGGEDDAAVAKILAKKGGVSLPNVPIN